MDAMKNSEIDTAKLQRRDIAIRTRGTDKGFVTQYVSPSELGDSVKPFVLLAHFNVASESSFEFPRHPHSGLVAVTIVLEGRVELLNSTGEAITLNKGSVEYLLAGRGVWHGGPVSVDGPMHSYVMWLALPPTYELTAPRELLVDASAVPTEGNARVLLGRFRGSQSPLPLPSLVTCLHIELRTGESWTYHPPAGHDVLWMVVCTGSVRVGESINEGELVIFDRSNASVEFVAQGECSMIIGSAPFSPYDIVELDSSVHTDIASSRVAKDEILRAGEELRAGGRLTAEEWEHSLEQLRKWD
jgi:redox-sensitive bicupin YhaK (pirin superfamily)